MPQYPIPPGGLRGPQLDRCRGGEAPGWTPRTRRFADVQMPWLSSLRLPDAGVRVRDRREAQAVSDHCGALVGRN
jgi:hypothetical protein